MPSHSQGYPSIIIIILLMNYLIIYLLMYLFIYLFISRRIQPILHRSYFQHVVQRVVSE